MINLSVTKDKELIKKIITNPVLMDDRDLQIGGEDLIIPDHIIWLLGQDKDNKYVGLIEIIPFTDNTAFGHIHLLPEYRGSGKALELIQSVKKFLKEEGHIQNVLTSVPVSCGRVLKLMNKSGFKVIGTVKDGITYHNKIQDLILHQLEI